MIFATNSSALASTVNGTVYTLNTTLESYSDTGMVFEWFTPKSDNNPPDGIYKLDWGTFAEHEKLSGSSIEIRLPLQKGGFEYLEESVNYSVPPMNQYKTDEHLILYWGEELQQSIQLEYTYGFNLNELIYHHPLEMVFVSGIVGVIFGSIVNKAIGRNKKTNKRKKISNKTFEYIFYVVATPCLLFGFINLVLANANKQLALGILSVGLASYSIAQTFKSRQLTEHSTKIAKESNIIASESKRISAQSRNIANDSDRKMTALANENFLMVVGIFEDKRMLLMDEPSQRRRVIWKCYSYIERANVMKEFCNIESRYQNKLIRYFIDLIKQYPWGSSDIRCEEIRHILSMYSYILKLEGKRAQIEEAMKLLKEPMEGITKTNVDDDKYIRRLQKIFDRYDDEYKFQAVKEERKKNK